MRFVDFVQWFRPVAERENGQNAGKSDTFTETAQGGHGTAH